MSAKFREDGHLAGHFENSKEIGNLNTVLQIMAFSIKKESKKVVFSSKEIIHIQFLD